MDWWKKLEPIDLLALLGLVVIGTTNTLPGGREARTVAELEHLDPNKIQAGALIAAAWALGRFVVPRLGGPLPAAPAAVRSGWSAGSGSQTS